MSRSFTDQYVDSNTRLNGGPSMAVMTIDSQRDWVEPDALYYIAAGASVIPNVARLVEAARDSDASVYHVLRLYLGDGSNADLCRINDLAGGGVSCLPGSDGAELVDALKPSPELRLDASTLLAGELQRFGPREFVAYKPRFGAFSQPSLATHLRAAGIDSLLICGVSWPRCVISSVLGAVDNDFRVGVVVDATSEVIEEQLAYLTGVGVQAVSTEEAIQLLRSPAAVGVS